MSTISFSGLVSGLDTGTMIDQLVAAERSGANTLAARQSDLDAQKSIVSSLTTAMSSLGTLARGMDVASELQPRTATVSDSKLSVAVSSSATPGVHDFRVHQLAAAQVSSSQTFTTSTAGSAGSGSLGIAVGASTATISWTSADSLADIAAKINGADAGVTASVLYDGSVYRLMVTAESTGTAAAPTLTSSALTFSTPRPAKDAIVDIDGIPVTRPTNVIDDALAGMTITLNGTHADTDASAKATISFDQKALTDKVKKLVDSFNAVTSALHVQLDYTGTKKGTNTLFGDSTLRQLQSSLGMIAGNAYGDSNLGALGITRDRYGMMTLDETKLASALSANPNAVANVFTGGFAKSVGDLADTYTQSGTGIFATKTQSLVDRRKSLQDQIDRINDSADALKSRLEKQFNALEQAMAKLQQQSTYLSKIL